MASARAARAARDDAMSQLYSKVPLLDTTAAAAMILSRPLSLLFGFFFRHCGGCGSFHRDQRTSPCRYAPF